MKAFPTTKPPWRVVASPKRSEHRDSGSRRSKQTTQAAAWGTRGECSPSMGNEPATKGVCRPRQRRILPCQLPQGTENRPEVFTSRRFAVFALVRCAFCARERSRNSWQSSLTSSDTRGESVQTISCDLRAANHRRHCLRTVAPSLAKASLRRVDRAQVNPWIGRLEGRPSRPRSPPE